MRGWLTDWLMKEKTGRKQNNHEVAQAAFFYCLKSTKEDTA